MSKIDNYKKQQQIVDRVVGAIRKGLQLHTDGTHDSKNDKACFKIHVKDVELGYGYYGCSSYYNCSCDEATVYIIAAMKEFYYAIGMKAIQLAEASVEDARIAAIKEAEDVLKQTTK